DERGALTEAIGAAKQHNDQMTREYCDHFTLLEELWLPIYRQNQTVTRSACAPRFDSIDAIFPQKFVRVAKHIIEAVSAAIERNRTLLLRHVRADARSVAF